MVRANIESPGGGSGQGDGDVVDQPPGTAEGGDEQPRLAPAGRRTEQRIGEYQVVQPRLTGSDLVEGGPRGADHRGGTEPGGAGLLTGAQRAPQRQGGG